MSSVDVRKKRPTETPNEAKLINPAQIPAAIPHRPTIPVDVFCQADNSP